jgi:ABC-type thiamine transport system substrate-binding protein
MMESLTDEIYEKAMKIIDEVEEKGGMTAFINSGAAKLMIEESATKKQGRIDSGKDVVVGVNKYRLSEEDETAETIDVLRIDNSGKSSYHWHNNHIAEEHIVLTCLFHHRCPYQTDCQNGKGEGKSRRILGPRSSSEARIECL